MVSVHLLLLYIFFVFLYVCIFKLWKKDKILWVLSIFLLVLNNVELWSIFKWILGSHLCISLSINYFLYYFSAGRHKLIALILTVINKVLFLICIKVQVILCPIIRFAIISSLPSSKAPKIARWETSVNQLINP